MVLHIGLMVLGTAGLWLAGDKLVDFAAALAERARLSPAVIGLTVVAAGTSFPELFVSVAAAWDGSPDIAVGNVVGSNISNLTLVLGAVALAWPVPIAPAILRLEYPVMMLSGALVLVLSRDGLLDRVEAALLTAAMVAFISYSVWLARRVLPPAERQELAEQVPPPAAGLATRPLPALLLGLLVTLVALSVSASALVNGAIHTARMLGITERVIGLTVVAVGTSLPELAASLLAARRGHHEMAVANVVGSNVFNTLMILGVAGLVTPIPVAAALSGVDMWIMLATGGLLGLLTFHRQRVSRPAGALLVTFFAVYCGWLLLGGTPAEGGELPRRPNQHVPGKVAEMAHRRG
ncbi:MAG: calcium/sodium antiporter [Deltaproteobacteria bacterium]|nr:calcium/sodium antiporter [Deltaproteobacteria bacterium]